MSGGAAVTTSNDHVPVIIPNNKARPQKAVYPIGTNFSLITLDCCEIRFAAMISKDGIRLYPNICKANINGLLEKFMRFIIGCFPRKIPSGNKK